MTPRPRIAQRPWLALAAAIAFLAASATTAQEGPAPAPADAPAQAPAIPPPPPVQTPPPPPPSTAPAPTPAQITKPAPTPAALPPAVPPSLPAAPPAAMPVPPEPETPAPQADADSDLQTLQFLDVDATEILAVYEQLTGKILIRDQGLAGVKLYVDSRRRISREERIHLIEATLFLNGFSLIPDKNNMVRVIGPAKAPSVANQAIRLLSDAGQVPDSDDIVSYFMQLEYLDPISTQQLFSQLLNPPNPFGKVVAAPNTSALIITDKGSIVLELIKLRELIDVPPSRLATKFVQLERADAERVAMILNEVIESRNSMTQAASRSGGGAPQPPQPPPQNAPDALIQALQRARGGGDQGAHPGPGGGAQDFNVLSRDTTLVADPRTNRILVITHPANFEYIKELIMEFDIVVDLTKPFVRPLRYILASEVMPILSEVLQEEVDAVIRTSEGGGVVPGAGGGTGTSRSGLTGSRTGTTGGSSRTTSSRSSTSARSRSTGGATSSRGGLTSGRSGGAGGLISEGGPTSISIGKIRLIGDDRSNTIMVMGPPESITKVQTIVDELDQRPKQVFLAVVIGRLAVGENLDYAVDVYRKYYPAADSGGAAGTLIGRPAASPVPVPQTLTTIPDFPAKALIPGFTLYGGLTESIDFFLEALESTDRFEIISRPSIYTANNRSASIINGERIAVPASTIQSDTGDNFRTNIEYEEIVLQIEVTPLINSNNEITLQIYQLNETQSGTTIIDGNPIPDIATQELSTEITVANRSTVLLGGLITTDVQDSSTGFPLLHRIPVLGALFGGKSSAGNRTELVILIQPIVLDTDADTFRNTVVEMDQTQLGYKWLEANGMTNAAPGPSTLIETRDHELEEAERLLLQQQAQQPRILPSHYPEALPPVPQLNPAPPQAQPQPPPAKTTKTQNGPRGSYSPISTKHR